MSSKYGFLGSIDANTGDELLGWDTDQFPMDIKQTMLTALIIMEQGGLGSGGLNFDAKVRRESTDVEDMFIAHIGAMDAYGRGLKAAAALKADGKYDAWRKARYATFDSGIGAKIEAGKTSFAELEAYTLANGEPVAKSGKQEAYEQLLNYFV